MDSRCTAVVPVYNEANTIRGVVEALLACERIGEVIVVDDASTDETATVLKGLPVRLVANEINLGKDRSVILAARRARFDRLFLADGDLVGLEAEHVDKLIAAAEQNRLVLGIIRPQAVLGWLFFLNRYVFSLTGLRVLHRDDLLSLGTTSLNRYRLESFLNVAARRQGWKVKKVVLRGIIHVIKERKGPLLPALHNRALMALDILVFYVKIMFK